MTHFLQLLAFNSMAVAFIGLSVAALAVDMVGYFLAACLGAGLFFTLAGMVM